jgi:ADP-ribosyl-[dinitrogen reductase] hydrolase
MLRDGVMGLLVGDALGVPYEFHPAAQIPPLAQIEMTPPPGFRRAHPSVPPGTWSDDGAQALCLLASLQERGRFDEADFAAKLIAWDQRGYLAVDGHVFDIGIQTSRAIGELRRGGRMPVEERGQGNGGLMRILPLALWHQGDDAALVADARASSALTHPHPVSQLTCALYCLWARALVERQPFATAVERFRAVVPDDDVATVAPLLVDAPIGRGSGWVVDSFLTARMLLADHARYEDVVKHAIALGDDTDTTAAIAGGLAALRTGLDDIPRRWRDALRGQDLLRPLL